MKKFFKSVQFKVIVCVLAALLAGMIIAAFTSDGTSPLTKAASVVYKPIQKLSSAIAEKTADFKGSFVSSSKYKEQVSQLQDEVDDLNGQLVDYERTKQKLGAYEAFLSVKEDHPDYEFAPASIVSRNSSDVYDSVTLDKGSKDGISVDDPVVYGSNVVGLVKKVNTATCVVKTILDPSLNISVYEIKSRENGYATTTESLSGSGLCKMAGLSKETAVTAGGVVCTSGLGGIFPRDLQLGTITEMKDETTDVSVYAVIKPTADITSLSDVFIITAFDGQHEEE